MTFLNRKDAGQYLADRLQSLSAQPNVIVLGIPRGGVPIAFAIAMRIHAPLEVFLSRKLGVPSNPELAFGAVAAEGGTYLDQEVIQAASISPRQIEQITQKVKATLELRARLYRGDRPPIEVAGKTVILVDDGVATGASVIAAIEALRQMKPAFLILAVPVLPIETRAWMQSKVDRLVYLVAAENFTAVGQFYDDFSQVSDDEVTTLLRQAQGNSSTREKAVDEPSETFPRGI